MFSNRRETAVEGWEKKEEEETVFTNIGQNVCMSCNESTKETSRYVCKLKEGTSIRLAQMNII